MEFKNADKDEVKAFFSVRKRARCLVGIGAFRHVAHCFAIGYPDVMLLFDPQWDDYVKMEGEIELLNSYRDEKMDFSRETEGDVEIVSYGFGGKEKKVYFFKKKYCESILDDFKVDVFHMGHAVLCYMKDEGEYHRVIASVLKLPVGAVIMNVFEDCLLSDFIYSRYFLKPVNSSVQIKEWSIDETENGRVLEFAESFAGFVGCLRDCDYFRGKKAEWPGVLEELRKKFPQYSEEKLKKHQDFRAIQAYDEKFSEFKNSIENVLNLMDENQKNKLVEIIRSYSNSDIQRFINAALDELPLG